jgi:hypothetical protein
MFVNQCKLLLISAFLLEFLFKVPMIKPGLAYGEFIFDNSETKIDLQDVKLYRN